jgi:hypothetical protein
LHARGADAGGAAAKPFAELGLVGEAFGTEGALEAVVGLQPLGVGQAHPAAAQCDDELRGHDLGRAVARLVRAGIERGLGAEEFPQVEPFAERGHGHLIAIHRVAVGGTNTMRSLASSRVSSAMLPPADASHPAAVARPPSP